jgi:hypothetical protein
MAHFPAKNNKNNYFTKWNMTLWLQYYTHHIVMTQLHCWQTSYYTAKFNISFLLTFNDASKCYVSWLTYIAYRCIISDRCNTSTQPKSYPSIVYLCATHCRKRRSQNMELHLERIHIEILGMEMMLWQLWNNKEVNSINNICNSCGRTSTQTHRFYLWPQQFLTIFNNFNCILYTYIMYMSSSIYLRTNFEPEEDLRWVETCSSV